MIKTLIKKDEKEFYDILTEDWKHNEEDDATRMVSAYSKEGLYIGNKQTLKALLKKGITAFEASKESDSVVSIGFNSAEQKWYGWSHRAIFGFGIGSTCKKGDCHYVPIDFEEIKSTHYFGEPCHLLNADGMCTSTCSAKWEENPDDPLKSLKMIPGTETPPCECNKENCVFPTGRGEWTAKTLEDAKQMAKDFAESVG